MEKIQYKKESEQNNTSTLTFIKKHKTVVTAAVVAASLIGIARPSEKPAQARINPIVAGIIQGATLGAENGINYEIARHVGGFYNPYYGYNYAPVYAPQTGYNYAPVYTSPYSGYNYAPVYTPQYGGYNYAPVYTSPYSGYNYAPVYTPQNSGYNYAPVYTPQSRGYNYAPVYTPQYNNNQQRIYRTPVSRNTVVPYTGTSNAFKQDYAIATGGNYSQQSTQIPKTTVYPAPKQVISWPEERILALQKEQRQNEMKIAAIQKQESEKNAAVMKEQYNQNAVATPIKILRRKDNAPVGINTEKNSVNNIKNASLTSNTNGLVGAFLVTVAGFGFAGYKIVQRNNSKQDNHF